MNHSSELRAVAKKVASKDPESSKSLFAIAQYIDSVNDPAIDTPAFSNPSGGDSGGLDLNEPYNPYDQPVKSYGAPKRGGSESHEVSFTFSVPAGTKPDVLKKILEDALDTNALESEYGMLFEKSTVKVKRQNK